MATLASLGAKVEGAKVVRFNGQFEESSIVNRDGVPYWVGKLVEPTTIRCSTQPDLGAIEVDEIFMLEEVKDSDKWEGDATTGYYIPGFKTDYSVSHEVGLYQETTIAAWVKEQRDNRKSERKSSLLSKIKERNAALKS